jgi:uncharacterized protein YerC
MPHVSKKKLDEEVLDKLFRKLVATLDRAQGKRKLINVLEELLTDTEKVMLAKRLAVVLMLFGETPQHRISEILLVSPSTVSRLALQIEFGEYESLKLISKKEKADLEKIAWMLLTAGGIMPPKVGGKYWRQKRYKAILSS